MQNNDKLIPTLSNDTDIVDGEFTEIVDENSTELDAEDGPSGPLSTGDVLKSLKAAKDSGVITARQAKQIRRDMEIYQSHFTRKQTSNAARKTKRKAQKQARKVNRNK